MEDMISRTVIIENTFLVDIHSSDIGIPCDIGYKNLLQPVEII